MRDTTGPQIGFAIRCLKWWIENKMNLLHLATSLLVVSGVLALATPAAAKACSPDTTEIAILGVYYFVSEQNQFRQADDDELAPVRQQQIESFVDALTALAPTKILVERPYDQAELDRRYLRYLSDQYTLSAEETDQIGFRLARSLGHDRLYWVQYVGDFPFDAVQRFAIDASREAEIEVATAPTRRMLAQVDRLLAEEGIMAAMAYINSPEALAANYEGYVRLNALGNTRNPQDGERPGPALFAAWYATNLNIFANIQNLAQAGDRLLVIYGQGHVPILNQLIDADPRFCRIDMAGFLAQKIAK